MVGSSPGGEADFCSPLTGIFAGCGLFFYLNRVTLATFGDQRKRFSLRQNSVKTPSKLRRDTEAKRRGKKRCRASNPPLAMPQTTAYNGVRRQGEPPLEEAAQPERESDMFLIATITNISNAPSIRRQLKAQGFGYNRARREWVKNCMTLRGTRLDLPQARSIDGVTIQLRSVEDMHTIINAAVAGV